MDLDCAGGPCKTDCKFPILATRPKAFVETSQRIKP